MRRRQLHPPYSKAFLIIRHRILLMSARYLLMRPASPFLPERTSLSPSFWAGIPSSTVTATISTLSRATQFVYHLLTLRNGIFRSQRLTMTNSPCRPGIGALFRLPAMPLTLHELILTPLALFPGSQARLLRLLPHQVLRGLPVGRQCAVPQKAS
jgi:hypothetical protein